MPVAWPPPVRARIGSELQRIQADDKATSVPSEEHDRGQDKGDTGNRAAPPLPAAGAGDG